MPERPSFEMPPVDEIEKDGLTPESVSFDGGKGTLLLNIDKSTVDLDILKDAAADNGLEAKEEFHITVLGFKNGRAIQKALAGLPETERQAKMSQINSIIGNTDWRFSFEPKRYHIAKEYIFIDKSSGLETKERRESYIQTLDLPGLEKFYVELNSILGTSLEAPPAHLTLYTGGDDKEKSKMGIGINSQAEFHQLNPELIQL